MTNVTVSFNNFSRGQIDHDMMGRYDLPIYSTGSDVFRNYISNFKGNAIFRTGFEDLIDFQDCALIEFKFSASQNYILVLYNLKMRFLSYASNGDFGWVESSPGVPLEVTTPYTLAQSKVIALGKPAQNADVMVFTHPSFQPYKLIRTSATSFTFLPFARLDDPFGLTYAGTTTITGITNANPAVVTDVGHGYTTGDMVKIAAVVGMTQINGYTARVTVINANSFSIDVNTSNTALFTAYSSGGTAAKLSTASFPALSLFYKGRLYYAASDTKITTVWGSYAGAYDTFTLSGTITDASALQFTIADISQRIAWLFGGENSLIAGAGDGIVAINGGDVGKVITAATVTATLTSAEGCNSAYPLQKDGLVFYVSLNNREVYYFNYDLLTARFIATDSSLLAYDISLGGLTKLRYKKDRNNLIYSLRGDGAACTVNFYLKENIIGWHEQMTSGDFKDIVCITDNNGSPQIFALVLRGSSYYIERQAEYVEFAKRVDFFTDPTDSSDEAKRAAQESDDEAYTRYIAEQLKGCLYLDNALTYSDLRSATITYSPMGGTITAGSNSFVSGDVGKHIVYRTATGYESGRFEITGYTSATVVSVTVLQAPTANVYSDWYMSFSTISGLSQYNGTTIGCVVDGGYLKDFAVSGGVIALEDQYTFAVMGYKYKGIIKSFCLGFTVQGENTQATMKAINRVGIRTVTSAGGKFGSSLYALEPVQELGPNDLNYLPPLPIDGTKYIDYVDDNKIDKFFYIVQDEPLPFHITSVIIQSNYTIKP